MDNVLNPPSPTPNVISVMHETEEWKTHFGGDITKVHINGEEVLKDHNLAKQIERVGRQVRVLAIAGVGIAIAVLVIVSLILHKKIDEVDAQASAEAKRLLEVKQHINSRLYELTGNIWHKDEWIVDPRWQQNANITSTESIQAD